ncbi:hypothetical protein K493DRAFT_320010 [Basidiobolus meristosporus CBS 931.73]|uniref:Ubiquitin-like domain-containing protein n=1 Tax=Basidiobolus meristosporus CBS 931.73 TaxID=1314790 RepID=A0A1Y1XHC0_9FUNG|nr:hypothetical protein K493DRAFT_320010 [Basidiobolus meristosporus CBS 931.73]|eukprot:ORX85158.1 hypothetical protein K493DRAFT_320010 [Basidiobolus meristosporus CBS 931.73]
MGCCASQPADDEVHNNPDRIIPEAGNKPLRKKVITWTSETPITATQLQSQRDGFWDTAPTYEGRREIWERLRAACETSDLVHAQAIVNELHLSVPTGHLSDGCYDELGNRYIVPQYCFSDPTNLITASSESSTKLTIEPPAPEYELEDKKVNPYEEVSDTSKPQAIPAITVTEHPPEPEKEAFGEGTQELTVRLSTGKDVRIKVNPTEDLNCVKTKVCAAENVEPSTVNMRFIYLGKIVDQNVTIEATKVPVGGIIQALVVLV